MSIYLGEQTLNSLLSLCNKSSQSNESYENKIKILKNEKVLLNDEKYTNIKTLSSLNKNGNNEQDANDSDSVEQDATDSDSVPHVAATDSVPHVAATDSVPHVAATDSVPHVAATDSIPHVAATDSIPHVAATDSVQQKLNAFLIDGDYLMHVILLPAAGLVNGLFYSNIPTRISSKRSITTNQLLQKNVRSVNDAIDRDIIQFTSFNINLDSIFVDPKDGSAMVGKYNINDSHDKCEIKYRGFQEQHDNNVDMLFQWRKSPNGTYYITMYIIDETNDRLIFSGVYMLTKMP
jgi:hypothetical protein